jgi:hypothetical protein
MGLTGIRNSASRAAVMDWRRSHLVAIMGEGCWRNENGMVESVSTR